MTEAQIRDTLDAIYRRWPSDSPRSLIPLAFGPGTPGYARYRLDSDGEYHLYGYRYMP